MWPSAYRSRSTLAQAMACWTLRNNVHWNFNRNTNIFIEEIAFKNVVCEMASILFRPQCAKPWIRNYIPSFLWDVINNQIITSNASFFGFFYYRQSFYMDEKLHTLAWVCYEGNPKYLELSTFCTSSMMVYMGLLPDTQNCGMRMRLHHGTCVTRVPWCMPGSLTSDFLWSRWQENVPGIPGSCATRNITYLVRGP